MKKAILILIAFTGISFAVKGQPPVVSSDNSGDAKAPVMTFVTDTIDFGTVTQGTIVVKDYKFTNTGKSPLEISSATGSCSCTVPVVPKAPVMPGKSDVITVRFDSTGKLGEQMKTATITSNNRDGTVVLVLKGNVVAAASQKSDAPAGNK